MIDANCHLIFDSLWGDRHAIFQRARQVGVQLLVVSTDTCDGDRVARLIEAEREGHRVAAGWHPLFEAPTDALDQLQSLLHQHPTWGVGEIGLDTRQSPADIGLFQGQLHLAKNRFCILHAVGPGAIDQAYQAVRAMAPQTRGMVHAFSGSWEQAKQWLDLGWYLSIGGPITRPNARRLRDWVRQIPLDRLLLESDSPDLAPVDWQGANEPASLVEVAACVAQLRQTPSEQIRQQTAANTRAWLDG